MIKQKKATGKRAAKTAKASKNGATASGPKTKLGQLETMLRRPDGATVAQLSKALGWLPHSVRGAMAGTLKKRGLSIGSEKTQGNDRVYRIAV